MLKGSHLNWLDIRDKFSILNKITYLNTASVGLMPRQSINAAINWLKEREHGNIYWLSWYEKFNEAKELFSRLIRADPDEISGVTNTSEGLNLIANSIKWEKGDNIIINDQEFPTNIYIWKVIARKHGLNIKIVRGKSNSVKVEDYESVIDDKTKAIAVSWVQFSNGAVSDIKALAKLAHEKNGYIIVDGIQGVGSLKINVKEWDIDFLSCGGHKWLMGLPGSGFLYVKKDIINELDIPFAGWLGNNNVFDFSSKDFSPAPGARRFELGSPNFIGYVAILESLRLILEIGIEKIESRNITLAKALVEKIGEKYPIDTPIINGSPQAPIVKIIVKNPTKIAKKLQKWQIYVAARLNGIRVSMHFYNNEEDIDKLLEKLGEKT